MQTQFPQPMTVTWSTSNTGTGVIPSHLLPQGYVHEPHQYTPEDVAKYLMRMDCIRVGTSKGEMWQRIDNPSCYLTWEQAVVYCLVKPWLTGE